MRARLRRAWLPIHRWVGLACGVVLLFAAVTGSLLVLAKPADEVINGHLFRVPAAGQAPLQVVVQALRRDFGQQAGFVLRNLGHPGESLHVTVSGPWQGTVYLDPSTARQLGRRASGHGFFNLLFELHSTLYAGDIGRAVLASAALAYVAMLLTGAVLWWPARWSGSLSIRRNASLNLLLFDLHRVTGVVLGVLVLSAVASGAYMAWRPMAGWVTQLSGHAQVPAPAAVAPPPAAADDAEIDLAVRRAAQQWPGAWVGAVQVPPGNDNASRVRLRLPDDRHPVGMSSVWLDPRTGAMLASHRWSELDPGTKAYSFIYPLHAGGLAGTATLLLTFVGGLALAVHAGSGYLLWWRRRAGRANPAGSGLPR